jgi:hypothetical protein
MEVGFRPVLPEYLYPLKRLDFGEVPSSGSSFIMVMKAADFWYLLDLCSAIIVSEHLETVSSCPFP